jgi:transcriptional regulator with XRE-family HTH domain
MGNRPRALDPHASPAALFGVELRAMRTARGWTMARLGLAVHVSPDLIGKIEKADRRALPELVARLDDVLDAGGRLVALGTGPDDDPVSDVSHIDLGLPPGECHDLLRSLVDATRDKDHAMSAPTDAATLVAHAEVVEKVVARVGRTQRRELGSVICETYQLAAWMCFDQARLRRAEKLFAASRAWAERAGDPALVAYLLGPNMSFAATHSGRPALGVERAYAALGWARRSGNHRLAAFVLAVGARAHARLGETRLCLELLDQAACELGAHAPDEHDPGWLSVFDHSALSGHRGSCLLDVGLPDRAVEPLTDQATTAPQRFVRNRMIWQLDRIDALLGLGEVEEATTELLTAATATPRGITARVRSRFHATQLGFPDLPQVRDTLAQVRELTAAPS